MTFEVFLNFISYYKSMIDIRGITLLVSYMPLAAPSSRCFSFPHIRQALAQN